MATKKKVTKTDTWPKVEKGTHLTVYTYEDGSTELEWDDQALLNEVRNAILQYEFSSSTLEKPKKTSRKKKSE